MAADLETGGSAVFQSSIFDTTFEPQTFDMPGGCVFSY